MSIAVFAFVLTIMLSDYVSLVSVVKSNEITLPIIDYSTRVYEENLLEGIQEDNNSSKLKISTELKTSDQGRLSDVPLLSNKKINTDDMSVTTKFDIFPISMSDSPLYIDWNKYIKNDRYMYRGRSYHNERDIENDQNSEFSMSHVNTLSKLNRHNNNCPSGHVMSLNRYGPLTDVHVSEDDEHANGYGFVDDRDNSKVGGDTVFGWYAEPSAYSSSSSRPWRHEAAENRGPTMVVDLRKLVALAAIKIALVKLTAIKALKLLLFLFIKLKLIAVLTVFLAGKFLVLGQIVKLFLLPIVWSWFVNATNSALQAGTNFASSVESINSSTTLSGATGTAKNVDSYDGPNRFNNVIDPLTPSLATKSNRLVTDARSAEAHCLQTMACRAAVARSPGFQSIWLNGVLSSLIEYIPSKKLKLYVSIYKDVTVSRLENILGKSSTNEDWMNWCNKRYNCDDDVTINNN